MLETMQYDLWSDGYGESVHLLDDNDEYPVAGYENLLNKVYNIVRSSDAKVLLDAGFGTGILTKKLYEDGYEIYGIDSSEQMVEAGQECMPNAHLKTADYSMGLPLSFTYKTYDMIISTYAFHHLDRYEKVNLMKDMLRQVKDGGKVVIGDLGFETAEEMKQFRKANKGKWLYEDLYMIYDEAIKDFDNIVWEKVSKCAGILTITK